MAGIVDYEETELLAVVGGVGGQLLADVLDVLLDFGIGDYAAGVAQALVDGPADLQFLVPGQHRVGRAADVRQFLVGGDHGRAP